MDRYYRVKAPDEEVRYPIQGEIFSTDAIENPADALAPEASQNAIDSGRRDAGVPPVEPRT